MGLSRHSAIALVVVVAAVAGLPGVSAAEDSDGATLQERFAAKEGRFHAHLSGTALLRDDFYRSPGYGVDLGYFFGETWGAELSFRHIVTRLSHTGRQMADEHNLTPDMRAPQAMFTGGTRVSWGYGKMLTPGDFVVHFDPQLVAQAGVTLSEERLVPTATGGIGFFTHWRYGIQIKLDLEISLHLEGRDRGAVVATGFAPQFAIGWSPRPEEWE